MPESHMEDEDKIGSSQDVINAEHERAHDKEPSKEDLIKAYLEEEQDEKEEKEKELAKTKGKVIEEKNKYSKS